MSRFALDFLIHNKNTQSIKSTKVKMNNIKMDQIRNKKSLENIEI